MLPLVDLVNRHRVRISDVRLSDIRPANPYRAHVKAAIAEALVQRWLSRVGQRDPRFAIDDSIPREQNGYVLLPKNQGILVFNGRRLVGEFDNLATYDGRPYVVEVKSNGFDPDLLKPNIRKKLSTARRVYDRDDVGLLLFFPIYSDFRAQLANGLQRDKQIQCIDLGYDRRELERRTTEFYKGLRKK